MSDGRRLGGHQRFRLGARGVAPGEDGADDQLQLVEEHQGQHDQAQVRAHYALLYDDLAPYADLEALLSAMRTFISYL